MSNVLTKAGNQLCLALVLCLLILGTFDFMSMLKSDICQKLMLMLGTF